MKGFKKALGPIGLALILVGGVTYGILYTSGWPAFMPLLAGLTLAVIYIITSYKEAKTEGYRRAARFSINAGVSIIFLAAILILLQTLSSRHSARIDTTKNKRYSLAPQTEKILEGLETDINFTCFFKETTPGRLELEDLLKEYVNKNPRINFRFIDPDKDPLTARRYEINAYGTIVVESGEIEEKLDEITENKLTNAILKVTREKKKVIYFSTGHGEKSIEDLESSGFSGVKEAILEENYDVNELPMLEGDSIPNDCEILIVAGPKKDIFPGEREVLGDYLSNGGMALFLLDPLTSITGISDILDVYGIEMGNDFVIDRFGKLLAGNYLTPIVNQYGDHPITEGFKLASFFPQTRSVKLKPDQPSGVTAEIICYTGTGAYAETDVDTLLGGKTQYEGGKDLAGPVPIAAVSTRETPTRESAEGPKRKKRRSRIAVIGDSDFASNANLNLSGHKDLIMNTINWLAEEEDLVSIRPRDALTQPVILTARQGRVVFWLPVVGLPALVAVMGIMVAVHKRRSA